MANRVCSCTSFDAQCNPLYLGGVAVVGIGLILGGIFGHQVSLLAVGSVIDASVLLILAFRVKKIWNDKKEKERTNAQFGMIRGSDGKWQIPENQIIQTISFK